MDLIDAAAILTGSGRDRQETATPTVGDVTTIAEAVSDSADGLVMVDLGGESITEDDVQEVEAECTCEVRAGDIVSVTMTGARGRGMTCTVTGVVGGGDRTRAEVVAADTKATDAQRVATQASTQLDAMRQQAEKQAQAVQGLQSAVQAHYSEQSELASLVSDHTTQISQTAAQLQQVATKTEQIDGLSQRVETVETSLTQTADAITLEAEARTATDDALADLTQQLGNETAARQEGQDAISNQLNDEIETRKNWMRFDANGMELGASDSDFKTRLDNKELGFYNGDVEIARAAGDAFEAPKVRAGTVELTPWAWVVAPTGELQLKYIGE